MSIKKQNCWKCFLHVYDITATHQWLDCLLNKLLNNKQNIKDPHYLSFVREMHSWWLHSPHKRLAMGLLPDTQNNGLCMHQECRRQRKPLFGAHGMYHGTFVTHVPWCMSGSLTRDGGENVPGIPGAYATRNFVYLVRSQYGKHFHAMTSSWRIWKLFMWKVSVNGMEDRRISKKVT